MNPNLGFGDSLVLNPKPSNDRQKFYLFSQIENAVVIPSPSCTAFKKRTVECLFEVRLLNTLFLDQFKHLILKFFGRESTM